MVDPLHTLQWHGYLLCYGLSSALLWDAVAKLACLLANGIVKWEIVLGGITFLLPLYGIANLERYSVFHGI